jgi:hypothetical protein
VEEVKMIELRNKQQMERAIKRAQQLKPFVRVRGFRWYEVKSSKSEEIYTLHFYKDGKRRLAECTCKGNQSGYVCLHIAAAAAVHIGIASMRRAA